MKNLKYFIVLLIFFACCKNKSDVKESLKKLQIPISADSIISKFKNTDTHKVRVIQGASLKKDY